MYTYNVLQTIKNKDMKKEIKNVIETYQCSGCIEGHNISCFKHDYDGGVGCGNHMAGTILPVVGTILLGLPKGFNRLGTSTSLRPKIYETFESSEWKYDVFNVPMWKHLSKEGHTFVRGFMPRLNTPFLHIFLEDCTNKINCLEISQEQIDAMD
jgi:hypothetical protein